MFKFVWPNYTKEEYDKLKKTINYALSKLPLISPLTT